MPRPSPTWLALALLLASILPATASAQEPAPMPLQPQPQPNPRPWELGKDIKPLPIVPIPDDPPPHEGAMFDIPYLIEPPDIILVEVLEALPGRPITGERLVRPDGVLSLGFYGDLNVRGLTIEQVKVKVVRLLQEYISDDVLGLRRFIVEEGQEMPVLTPAPLPIPATPGTMKPANPPEEAPPAEIAPIVRPGAKPAATAGRSRRPARPIRRARTVSQVPPAQQGGEAKPADKPDPEMLRDQVPQDGRFEPVEPAKTVRVFVDIASYNSKVYFVQGDVGISGRLPFTGNETILDAINYAGGLTPTAEPTDVHLYRPARGGKPARDYKIDLMAILKGDARANLQMFPDDRLVIGRNRIVQKTIEIDRAVAPIASAINSSLQQSFAARTLGMAMGDVNGTNQVQRDAALKSWTEFLFNISSKEGGAMLDDKAFREAVMKQLGPPPTPK